MTGGVAAALAAGALGATAPAAARTYLVPVAGAEIWASDTVGRFAGTSAAPARGAWKTTVVHTPLHGHATITGGSWSLVGWLAGAGRRLGGKFTGGTVDVTRRGSGCTNERFAVVAVGPTARVEVTLTHHRRRLLGRCVTFSATVDGTIAVTLAHASPRRGAGIGDLLARGAGWLADRLGG